LSVNYIVRQDAKRIQRIRALMQYSFEVCYRFGDVWLSNDHTACALVLYPNLKRTTFVSVWLDIQLILCAIGFSGIKKALNREAQIKKLQPKKPVAYLWFIGVNPLYQHQGTGSRLLQEVMADAARKYLLVYLETSTVRNLPWYEKFGFEIYDQLDLGYVLFFLKHIPANS
jgi:ribosomal protein S18 acetylase RimI-like enzyme